MRTQIRRRAAWISAIGGSVLAVLILLGRGDANRQPIDLALSTAIPSQPPTAQATQSLIPTLTPSPLPNPIGYPVVIATAISDTMREKYQVLVQNELGPQWQPQGWDDFSGAFYIISTTDPSTLGNTDYTGRDIWHDSFSTDEIEYWNSFLEQHAAVFGIDKSQSIQLKEGDNQNIFNGYFSHPYLVAIQQVQNAPVENSGISIEKMFTGGYAGIPAKLVEIVIRGHWWPRLNLPFSPRLTTFDIQKMFVGQRWVLWDHHIADPISGQASPIPPAQVSIAITADNLVIHLAPYLMEDVELKGLVLR